MRSQNRLFVATAVIEIGGALVLLTFPSLAMLLLLGVADASLDALNTARLSGAGMLAIGSSCWFARNDRGSPSQQGLLRAILIYNIAVCVVLVFAATSLQRTGVALWPSVAVHTSLTLWCLATLRSAAVDPSFY